MLRKLQLGDKVAKQLGKKRLAKQQANRQELKARAQKGEIVCERGTMRQLKNICGSLLQDNEGWYILPVCYKKNPIGGYGR